MATLLKPPFDRVVKIVLDPKDMKDTHRLLELLQKDS